MQRIQTYVQNAQLALENGQVGYADWLLAQALQSPTAQQPQSYSSPMHLQVGVALDAGIKRQQNEDAFFCAQGTCQSGQQSYGLFVVADGMGGHASGQEASREAIASCVDLLLPIVSGEEALNEDAWRFYLTNGIRQANLALYQRNRQATAAVQRGMGTTMTAALVVGETAYIVSVGDSRAYLYRESEGLRQITRDHSTVARLVESGAIAPQDIYIHPKRNEIYRCLGDSPTVEIDLFQERILPGDTLLLCTDGLWEMVRDDQIKTVLASSWLSTSDQTKRLMLLALAGGGQDNVGLVVVRASVPSVSEMTTLMLSPLAARS